MLPAKHRLKGRKIFNDFFRDGKTFSNDMFLMKIGMGEESKPTQFSFGVGLKFSKRAVERNRVKRWMREAVRRKLAQIQPGHRVIFFINPKVPKKELDLQQVQEKVENLLKKAKII